MSDFIYSTCPQKHGYLSIIIKNIYIDSPPSVVEYHGEWGVVAISESRYKGYGPLETNDYLCLVIGAPVLEFSRNSFLTSNFSNEGTKLIFDRWHNGEIDWSEDLSGPFVVVIIDKNSCAISYFTDLMLFIPVYQFVSVKSFHMGTHVDALACACGQKGNIDAVSLADFIINKIVTYPHTAYKEIKQACPASKNHISFLDRTKKIKLDEPTVYWSPIENFQFSSINDAALALRVGVKKYVDQIVFPMSSVAHFISGGEDSRVVSGLLPKKINRISYIFLDSMNREGKIALKVAKIYGDKFTPTFRDPLHYLDILPEASRLVGSGHEYKHAHSLRFDRELKLSQHSAIFGGYLSDSLLKAQYALKPSFISRFSFLPQVSLNGETRTRQIKNPAFNVEILDKVTARRREHLSRIKNIRPLSAHEWFVLWPMTMRETIPNFYSNRRLFASYEPFTCKECVKISASIPVEWKLNRRIFNLAFRPHLYPSRWLRHGDGRLPYFPWWFNSPLQFSTWLYRHLAKRIGLLRGNQEPFGDWRYISRSQEWEAVFMNSCSELRSSESINFIFNEKGCDLGKLSLQQKINLIQACFLLKKLPVMDVEDRR